MSLLVLNTRPREQAAELSDLLREAGFDPLEVPAIETVAAWRADELRAVQAQLRRGDYAWAVFASRNAVRFFVEGLVSVGGSSADLAATRLLVGPGTAEALRAVGLAPARVLERFSAATALASLADAAGRVLVPRPAEGRVELIEGLAEVDAPVCYRTQSVPAESLTPLRDRLSELKAATFASPSAVKSVVEGLARLGAALDRVPVVCLGTTTAEAARQAGLSVARVAERTDLPSLVQAVAGLYPAEVGA
jgi:uroporphyrinogen-III synthase